MIMKKLFIILITAALSGSSMWAQETKKANTEQQSPVIESVDVKTFKELLTKHQSTGKVVLLDVRTAKEFEQGHIENAKNIDVLQKDFAQKVARLDKNTPVFVYCRSGHRSMNAAEILKKQGFTKVYNLAGGYMAWSKQNK